jgi:hypothetical protein
MSDRVIAHNHFSTFTGVVVNTVHEEEGDTLVSILLDGTNTTITVNDSEFRWFSAETEDYPLKKVELNGELTPTLRIIDLAHDSDSIEPMNAEEVTDQVFLANSVCSDQRIGTKAWGSDRVYWDSTNTHQLMIDIDVPAYLLPSSTPGHSHLYIDQSMDTEEWLALLIALRNAGIIESGYVGASIKRGYTALRLPWVSKRSGTDAMVG